MEDNYSGDITNTGLDHLLTKFVSEKSGEIAQLVQSATS